LIDWLGRHPSIHFHIKSAEDYSHKANVGLWLIGNPRKAGWPLAFSGAGTARERRAFAIILLIRSEPDKETLLPLLLSLIHDQDDTVRQFAAQAFNRLYPKEAEAAGVYKMFPSVIKNETVEWSYTN